MNIESKNFNKLEHNIDITEKEKIYLTFCDKCPFKDKN